MDEVGGCNGRFDGSGLAFKAAYLMVLLLLQDVAVDREGHD